MSAGRRESGSGKSGSRESQHPCGLEADGKSGQSRERVGNLSQSLTFADPGIRPGLAEPRSSRRRTPTAADRTPADLAPVLAPVRGAKKSREVLPAPTPKAARPLPVHEAAVIAAALAILDARLRTAGPEFGAPGAVKTFLRLHLAEREREAFGVLFLNTRHRLIAFEVMFEGTLTQTSVYPRELVPSFAERGLL